MIQKLHEKQSEQRKTHESIQDWVLEELHPHQAKNTKSAAVVVTVATAEFHHSKIGVN